MMEHIIYQLHVVVTSSNLELAQNDEPSYLRFRANSYDQLCIELIL